MPGSVRFIIANIKRWKCSQATFPSCARLGGTFSLLIKRKQRCHVLKPSWIIRQTFLRALALHFSFARDYRASWRNDFHFIFPFISRKNTSHLNQKGAKGGPSNWDIFSIGYNCVTWFSILEPITFSLYASLPSDENATNFYFFFVKIKLGQHFGVNRLSAILLILLRLEFYHEALLGVYWTPHNPKSGWM